MNADTKPAPDTPFKSCSACSGHWLTREDLIADPDITVVGYQAFVRDNVPGLFLFNHRPCGTTLAIPAMAFASLYDGPVYADRLDGSPDCPDYCLTTSNLSPCPLQCECAYVREILQVVKEWPKGS
jgi:hypothetical protein